MEVSQFFPIWGQLTPSHQHTLTAQALERTFSKGAIVHNGSLDCAGIFLIRSGQLRAYILSEEGREITIYRLFEGDICLFSATCIMRSIQFDIIIQAEKETEVIAIPPEIYQSVMAISAPLANYTQEIMASRFSDVMWILEQVMWKSFDKRLAHFLLEEAVLEGTTSLKITHEAIANHLGTAREVVTRMLRYFQSEGMVKLSRGAVELTDRKKLNSL